MTITGRCLCGAVGYGLEAPLDAVLHCHCENCRRVSGNFVAAAQVEVAALDIRDSARSLQWHDLGYSRYAFCRACGSTLFYQATDRPSVISVMVGTFDHPPDLPLAGVWFAADAQSHHELPVGVPTHDGNG